MLNEANEAKLEKQSQRIRNENNCHKLLDDKSFQNNMQV